MNNLLFTALIIALIYYFFVYLPSQKKVSINQPTIFNTQATQTEPKDDSEIAKLKTKKQELETELQTNRQEINQLQTQIRELVKRPVQPTNSKTTQTDDGKVVVYHSPATPQSVPSSQALSIAESDQYQLGILLRDHLGYTSLAPIIDIQELKKAILYFTADKQRYGEQLTIRLQEYTRLESKLEQVRNLLADNNIEQLKRLMKRGEV